MTHKTVYPDERDVSFVSIGGLIGLTAQTISRDFRFKKYGDRVYLVSEVLE